MRLVKAETDLIEFELGYGNTLTLEREEHLTAWQPKLVVGFDGRASRDPARLSSNIKLELERLSIAISNDKIASILEMFE